MNRNLIAFLLLTLLSGLAYWAYRHHGSGTIKPALHDFAVSDTSAVTRILLADKSGNKVMLERRGEGGWLVNGQFKAREDLVSLLLKTILRVEMKAPVAESAHDNVIRLLAGKSTRVEIFEGDNLVKAYFVGDATNDHNGTYMLMDGSGKAMITHIPGFHGYLTPRYNARALEWRDTEVFHHRIPEIAELSVDYAEHPGKSFRITRGKDKLFRLFTLRPEKEVPLFDTTAVMRYLLHYADIRFENIQAYQPERADSIVHSPWFYRIRLTEPGGRTRSVTTYRIPADPGNESHQTEWDPDRMHAMLHDDSSEVALIQYFVFDRLTVDFAQWVRK